MKLLSFLRIYTVEELVFQTDNYTAPSSFFPDTDVPSTTPYSPRSGPDPYVAMEARRNPATTNVSGQELSVTPPFMHNNNNNNQPARTLLQQESLNQKLNILLVWSSIVVTNTCVQCLSDCIYETASSWNHPNKEIDVKDAFGIYICNLAIQESRYITPFTENRVC